MKNNSFNRMAGITIAMLLPLCAHAQLVVKENFNDVALSSTTNTWTTLNGACLTASTSNTTFTVGAQVPGTIPGCVNTSGGANSYYKSLSSTLVGGEYGAALPDAAGSGVLRLTNGASSSMSSTNGNDETGAIIYSNAFPSSEGLNITFNTFTWGGNGYSNGSAKSGADGISFFLLDASQYSHTSSSPAVYSVTKTGAYGGSLGYDCAAGKYSSSAPAGGDGIIGAYLGLGIDEYGNFVNSGDNGNANDPLSKGALPNTVGLRGAGNINSNTYPTTSAGLPTGTNPAVGPIAQPQYICQYGYYTTSATATGNVTTQNNSGSQTLYAVTSATANVVAPGVAGTATVTWVSSVSTNRSGTVTSYTTTTGTYPVMGVYDYALMAYKNISTTTVGNIYNQEYIANPERLANPAVKGSVGAIPINYTINLTSTGILNVSYSYNGGTLTPVISQSILASNGPLPTNFLFGFASGTGGGSNNHEISCFQAVQIQSSSSSAGGNIPQNTRVLEGNQIYLASYNPLYWTGTVTATELNVDATTGAVTIQSTSVWDASCALSGSTACATTGGNSVTQQPHRAIAAWNDGVALGATTPKAGAAGAVAFTVANFSSLSGNVQQLLNCGNPSKAATTCDNYGADRIGFLIDGNTGLSGFLDSVPANTFRTRKSLLGDIINSSPVWVGAPSMAYGGNWVDNLYSSTVPPEGTSYSKTFQPAAKSRLNTVYVGANDGMVHGFAAGYGNVTSNSVDNTGVEVMAFLPSLALNSIHDLTYGTGELDYSGLLYAHNDYVDATPGTGDLYWSGAPSSTGGWQTWLVGGLGGGGSMTGTIGGTVTTTTATVTAATATNGVGEIYAINITNPIAPENLTASSGTTVAANVMGDWTTASIVCDTVVGITDTCNSHMGSTYGTPVIRRLHSGNWAIIFGNGLNSSAGTAGIFIIEVTGSSSSGAPTYSIHYIDTGAGTSSDPTQTGTVNGISYVTAVDLDGDHITDYVYAGDVLGNVWRFDLTSNTAANWGTNNGKATDGVVKIFAASTASSLQPITSQVAVATIPFNNGNGVIVSFGTGREIPQTLSSAAGYYPTGQYLYGIYDWNLAYWNSLGSTQYYTNGATSVPSSGLTLANLTDQTLTQVALNDPTNTSGASFGYTDSNNPVCFPFLTTCSGTPSSSYGWYIAMPNTQEQIIYNPVIEGGTFYINSVIPPDQIKGFTSCTSKAAGGYTYAVNIDTGGSNTNTFGSNTGYKGNLAGIGVSGVGTPYFVTSTASNGSAVSSMITQTSTGTPYVTQVPPPPTAGASVRLTWTELK